MTDGRTDRQIRQTELSAIRLIQYVFGYAPVRLELGIVDKYLVVEISRMKDSVASGRPCIHYGQI